VEGFTLKDYPDVSELFKLKAQWREQMSKRPVEEKLEVAAKLRRLAQEIPKLTAKKEVRTPDDE
jgi:hypothetical protein